MQNWLLGARQQSLEHYVATKSWVVRLYIVFRKIKELIIFLFVSLGWYYTFIACWWGKYENVFTQEYHISWGQCPRGIWYSWVNKFSYFLNPHAMNVLLYRMKPWKHIHVKCCWQASFKSIGTLSQTFKNHIHNHIVTVACKWCVPSASGVFLSKNSNSGEKTREASEGVEYIYFTEYDFCPVWSRVLIFTHCPIKLIYLWLLIYEV